MPTNAREVLAQATVNTETLPEQLVAFSQRKLGKKKRSREQIDQAIEEIWGSLEGKYNTIGVVKKKLFRVLFPKKKKMEKKVEPPKCECCGEGEVSYKCNHPSCSIELLCKDCATPFEKGFLCPLCNAERKEAKAKLKVKGKKK